MSEQHETLKSFINSLVKGNNTCLIVKGEAGIGKSETTMTALKELGYEKGRHYLYANNYLAPKSFYDFLYKSTYLKEPRIVVLDDIEECLKQSRIVGILKGALWQVDGKRRCGWVSGDKIKHFDFNGKLIIILNKFDEKIGLLNTLRDRSLYYEIGFTQEELIDLMLNRAKNMTYGEIVEEKRLEIAKFVISKVVGRKISLRDLQKGYDLFLGSGEKWKDLFVKQYETN